MKYLSIRRVEVNYHQLLLRFIEMSDLKSFKEYYAEWEKAQSEANDSENQEGNTQSTEETESE